MRIGIVDLDTSHPQAFDPLLRAAGHDIVGVVGGDTVVDPHYTAQYAAEHDIGLVASSPQELIGEIDLAFVHSVNWDHHVDRIRPFVEAGIGVNVCKPFAGSAADLDQLEQWVADGARISGGSALRWCAAAQTLPVPQAQSSFGVTYGHPLDYGIHAFAFVSGLMGPGMVAARALDDVGRQVQIRWDDGRTSVVHVLAKGEGYGFYATVAGQAQTQFIDATGTDLYGPFISGTLANLTGEAFEGPGALTFAELVEPERAVIAGRASASNDGRWVELRDDPLLADGSFDGAEFASEYAVTRRAALGLPAR